MNTRQKTVLLIGVVAFCLSILFVPIRFGDGYYPIFAERVSSRGVNIDIMIFEWAIIIFSVLLGLFVTRKRGG